MDRIEEMIQNLELLRMHFGDITKTCMANGIIDSTVKAIEKLAAYEDLGYTPEECRAAVERQNPRTIITEKADTETTRYTCPACGMYMGWSTGLFPARYCWKCGQKLYYRSDEE